MHLPHLRPFQNSEIVFITTCVKGRRPLLARAFPVYFGAGVLGSDSMARVPWLQPWSAGAPARGLGASIKIENALMRKRIRSPEAFGSNPSGGFCGRGALTPLVSGFAAHASRGEGTPPTPNQAEVVRLRSRSATSAGGADPLEINRSPGPLKNHERRGYD